LVPKLSPFKVTMEVNFVLFKPLSLPWSVLSP
jgi:hypothetical protein